MTCSCGDTLKIESASREEAVSKLQSMMNESMITAHMAEKHPGQPAMSVSEVHAAIEQTLKAV